MFLLLTGYFIAIASVTNPGNLAVTIGSFVPFTPPALLPFRAATVDTPAWQIGLSLAILAASIVDTRRIAGWIYCYSLLRTGTRVTWTEARKNRHNPSL
jgi:ABC-2 type transport system permease protein